MEHRDARDAPGPVAPLSSAIADVYDAHVEEVYRFVHRRCRDHSLAEDVTQETFTSVCSTNDPSSITIAWLLSVARNRLLDVLRTNGPYDGAMRLVGTQDAAGREAELRERLRAEAAVDQLRVDCRLVLTLHYIDGLTVGALAERLDQSAKSVEGIVIRARRELRMTLCVDYERREQVAPMPDELESELLSVVGESPSPKFEADLRDLVLADQIESEVAVVDDSVLAPRLGHYEEEKVMRNKWTLAGVAAASIALIAGFAVLRGNDDGGDTETVDKAGGSTTTEAAAPELPTTAPSTTAPSPTAPPTTSGPAKFSADAALLTAEFSPVAAGTYRVDTVGTPFSFTIAEERFVQPNRSAFFVLSHVDSAGPDDRDIVISRLTALLDPAQPEVQLTALGQGWSKDDFAGWLDNLTDTVVVTERIETSLGGLSALRVDIEVTEDACDRGPEFCVGLFSNGLTDAKSFNVGSKYRVWVVDQGSQDPLIVIVGISKESKSDWFDVAGGILSTLAFSDPGANPVLRTPVGLAELPLLGGIRVEVERETTVSRDIANFGRMLQDDLIGDAEFLTNPLDLEGNIIETTEDLLAVLRESSVELVELESITVGGFAARVFGTVGGAPGPAMLRSPDDERGWHTSPQGQFWSIEHPERGLLMINAWTYGDIERVFPIILAETEKILASLEFVDLG